MNTYKVGELSQKTGVSVRALHHYDEIGLLKPSGRTDSGHRYYTDDDVMKLQQILSLKALGFSLVEIGNFVLKKKYSLLEIVDLHLAQVTQEVEQAKQLKAQLEILKEHLQDPTRFRVTDLFEVIAMLNRLPRYFTADELETVRQRKAKISDERIQEVEREWPKLMQEVQAEMKAGTDPHSPKVQKLAAKWKSLYEEFTGGDPQVEAATANYLRSEPKVREAKGIDLDVMNYIAKAMDRTS